MRIITTNYGGQAIYYNLNVSDINFFTMGFQGPNKLFSSVQNDYYAHIRSTQLPCAIKVTTGEGTVTDVGNLRNALQSTLTVKQAILDLVQMQLHGRYVTNTFKMLTSGAMQSGTPDISKQIFCEFEFEGLML